MLLAESRLDASVKAIEIWMLETAKKETFLQVILLAYLRFIYLSRIIWDGQKNCIKSMPYWNEVKMKLKFLYTERQGLPTKHSFFILHLGRVYHY